MKKYFLFLLSLYNIASYAQNNSNESLDQYFAGIPLREGFEKWVHYVFNHPYMGVDSFNERGIYSSLKPGMKSHFPFADSVKVKLLFQKTIYYDSVTNVSTDSTHEISIEGIFPHNKIGRKQSVKAFRDLSKSLKAKYKRIAIEYSGRSLSLRQGRSESFPDCSIHQGYYEELRFYYVMINYSSPRKNPIDQ